MNNSEHRSSSASRRKNTGNLIFGTVLVIVGSLLFAREFGVDLPNWFFRWEMILIVVGLSIGIKSGFRDFGWIAVTGVGLFFLSDDIFPHWNTRRFLVPAGLLALGAFIILNRLSSPAYRGNYPQRGEPGFLPEDSFAPESRDQPGQSQAKSATERFNNRSDQSARTPDQFSNSGEQFPNVTGENPNSGDQFPNMTGRNPNSGEQFPNMTGQNPNSSEQYSNTADPYAKRTDQHTGGANQYSNPGGQFSNANMEEELLDIVSVFSAVNRKVFSKNFIGGEIVCVFGGSEVNLMNADISAGTIELEVVCIFGGATLFIPPNWNVRSEMGSVFGGVDDKRKNSVPDPTKTLIIKGVCIFGGLEIKTKYQ